MSSRIHNFPAVLGVTIVATVVPVSDKIASLGVTLISSLTFRHHVSNVCRSAYFHLRSLRHIRVMLTEDIVKTLATSFIHSWIDYTNSIIHGSINNRLQSVQNSVARVVLRDYLCHPAGDLLSELHWLPVQSRISFKIAFLTYKILSTGQHVYTQVLLHHYTPHSTLCHVNQHLLEQHQVSTEFGNLSFTSHLKHGTV